MASYKVWANLFAVWQHEPKSLFCAISNRMRSIVWSFALLVRKYDASNAYSFCIVERMQSLRRMWRAYLKADWNNIKTKHSKWSGFVWWNFGHGISIKMNFILFNSAVLFMLQSVPKIHISCEWHCFGWIQFNRIYFVWFGFVVFSFPQYDMIIVMIFFVRYKDVTRI